MVIPRREIERGRSQNTDENTFVSQSGSSGTPSKVAGAGQDEVGEFRVKLVFEKDKASFLQNLQLFHNRNGLEGILDVLWVL